MSIVTFSDKVALKDDPSVPRINKITDDDINELKNSTNALYAGEGGTLRSASRLITSAEILDLNSTPIVLVAAQGANKLIVPYTLVAQLVGVSIAYDTNTILKMRYVGEADNENFLANSSLLNQSAIFTMINTFNILNARADRSNKGIEIYVGTDDPLNGDGDLKVSISYDVIDLSLIV